MVDESQSTASSSHRRRGPRRIYTSRIGLLVKGKYYLGRGFEIGEDGVLIGGVPPLAIGQKVIVTFQPPGVQSAVVRGVVRDIQEKRAVYEIEFLNLDFNIKRAIRTFVASKTATKEAWRVA